MQYFSELVNPGPMTEIDVDVKYSLYSFLSHFICFLSASLFNFFCCIFFVHDMFFIDRLGTLDIWGKCIALSFQEKTPKSLNTLEFSYLFVSFN